MKLVWLPIPARAAVVVRRRRLVIAPRFSGRPASGRVNDQWMIVGMNRLRQRSIPSQDDCGVSERPLSLWLLHHGLKPVALMNTLFNRGL